MKNLFFRTIYTVMSALLFFIAPAVQAQPFNDIIGFGDSLTDVGNVAGLTVPGFSPVIDGYYLETHFSDNVIWIETLASYWGLAARTPGRGDSTTLPPLNGNTWAWGGSEAASGSVMPPGVVEPIPNLLSEIEEYLKANDPDPNTLYTIWSGADNLLIGGNFGPKAAKKAVMAIKIAIQRLEIRGARHILVFNMPRLGDTPSAQSGGEVSEIAANIYTDAFNKNLEKMLKRLCHRHFRARLYYVDVYTEIVNVVDTVNNGGTYVPSFFVPGPPVSISNVTDEALDVFENTGIFPTNYLFWDDVHPTTQGHQIIAGLVLRSLSSICRCH